MVIDRVQPVGDLIRQKWRCQVCLALAVGTQCLNGHRATWLNSGKEETAPPKLTGVVTRKRTEPARTIRSEEVAVLEFKVEKGVPLPAVRGRGKRQLYPWDQLAVGDSFFVPCQSGDAVRRRKSIATNGAYWYKKHGPNGSGCVCLVVEGGVRCWRVS